MVAISAISGTAGVGKTALAVHFAHQVAAKFPDGQLYANLRGFDPSGPPVPPAHPIRDFLDAFEVPAERIPVGLEVQAALYRSLVAGRRMLILLDNARDVAQVQPLLPASPGSLVLITSRNPLTPLAAVHGAQLLSLERLPEPEARDLLTARLGAARTAAEPEAADELIELCARLPLALAITAGRAAARPSLRLATLAAELRDTTSALDALDAGAPAASARTVFSWSYQQLTVPAARLFRVLGLHPGPDITAATAVSLAATSPAAARAALRELTKAGLITERSAGRYAFHDLLRAYASERAHAEDSHAQRRAAIRRMLSHYLHTACAADRLLNLGGDPISPAPPAPGTIPEEIGDAAGALRWFTAERQVLLKAVTQAGAGGFGTWAWQLAWVMGAFLNQGGHWHDWAAAGRTALAAAERSGDADGRVHAHVEMGRGHIRLGSYKEARAHLEQALRLAEELDGRTERTRAHDGLAMLSEREGRHQDQLSHALGSLRLSRASDPPARRARALNNVGWAHALAGNYDQAIAYCMQAIELFHVLGDRLGEAGTWDSVGYIHRQLGQHAVAIGCYQRAFALLRELGASSYHGELLSHLGDAYRDAGDREAARRAWQQALAIFDDLHHHDAEEVRAELRDLGTADGSVQPGLGGPGSA
jgi:tetratricopeptide (TPR) repeat protein